MVQANLQVSIKNTTTPTASIDKEKALLEKEKTGNNTDADRLLNELIKNKVKLEDISTALKVMIHKTQLTNNDSNKKKELDNSSEEEELEKSDEKSDEKEELDKSSEKEIKVEKSDEKEDDHFVYKVDKGKISVKHYQFGKDDSYTFNVYTKDHTDNDNGLYINISHSDNPESSEESFMNNVNLIKELMLESNFDILCINLDEDTQEYLDNKKIDIFSIFDSKKTIFTLTDSLGNNKKYINNFFNKVFNSVLEEESTIQTSKEKLKKIKKVAEKIHKGHSLEITGKNIDLISAVSSTKSLEINTKNQNYLKHVVDKEQIKSMLQGLSKQKVEQLLCALLLQTYAKVEEVSLNEEILNKNLKKQLSSKKYADAVNKLHKERIIIIDIIIKNLYNFLNACEEVMEEDFNNIRSSYKHLFNNTLSDIVYTIIDYANIVRHDDIKEDLKIDINHTKKASIIPLDKFKLSLNKFKTKDYYTFTEDDATDISDVFRKLQDNKLCYFPKNKKDYADECLLHESTLNLLINLVKNYTQALLPSKDDILITPQDFTVINQIPIYKI